MKKDYSSAIHYITAFVMLLFSGFVYGQQDNSLYFINRLPQSTQLNPALQPACSFYIGIPGLSSLEFNAGNNSVGVRDIIISNPKTGSTVTPLLSGELTNELLGKLRKNNIFSSTNQIDLFSMGFKVRENYVTFSISEKANILVDIPKDLFNFAYNGLTEGQKYSFDNLGINATYYREYALGYSSRINDKLYFGIRGKLLYGKANVSLLQPSFHLNEPDWGQIDVSAYATVNASVPGLHVYSNTSGQLDSITYTEPKTKQNYLDIFFENKNKGLAFDFGFNYLLNDKMNLSASVIDLGYINWKTNLHNLSGGGEYNFEGLTIDTDSTNDDYQVLIDTLKKVYTTGTSEDAYNTFLNPKLYVGFTFTPVKFLQLGFLSRTEYVFKTIRQQVTGNLVLNASQFLGVSFSYTIADRTYDNFGLGLVFRGGPVQFYLMSERVPAFYYHDVSKSIGVPYIPKYMKGLNVHFGFNLVFGANHAKKLQKDQPFLD